MRKFAIWIVILPFIACSQRTPAIATTNKNDTTEIRDTAKVNPETASIKSDDYDFDPVAAANEFIDFIPPGYAMFDTCSGDLNLDGLADIVLVLKKPGEDSVYTTGVEEKRPLLLLIANENKTYRLAGRNDNTVLCFGCGGMMGDPYMGIVIKNGFFSVEHYGGGTARWSNTITFKFSRAENNWFLHKVSNEMFQAVDPEKVTTTIYTTKDFGKVSFEDFDSSK